VASSRTRRRGLLTALSCLTALAAVAVPAGSAAGTPRPSLHQVQRQVDALNRQAGTATERYNDARVRLAAANRRLTVVRHREQAQQAAIRAMQVDVGRLATAAYKSGGIDTTLAILLADDPRSFLQSAVALSQLGRRQSDALAKVVQARRQLATAHLEVAQQSARSQAVSAEMAQQRKSVQDKLAQAKALLSTLRAGQRARLHAATRAAADRGHLVASRSRTGGAPGYDGPATGRAAEAVQTAFAQLGDPYVFGAAGPGSFDCSGLTMFAWAAAGVSLPHSSSAQYSSARHVSSSDLQPGDLVFYYSPISHVGIYIGAGRIIHAPHPGRSVEIAGLNSMPYVGAVRP
jgi:cell wall-associated NlpC family hydrolase